MYFEFCHQSIYIDISPSPVAIAKSHGKKCQNYFRVTTSPFAEMRLDKMLRKKGIKKKITTFDYCEEYLTNISNKILLWQN